MPESHACPYCCSRRITVVLESQYMSKYRCDKCGKCWSATEKTEESASPK